MSPSELRKGLRAALPSGLPDGRSPRGAATPTGRLGSARSEHEARLASLSSEVQMPRPPIFSPFGDPPSAKASPHHHCPHSLTAAPYALQTTDTAFGGTPSPHGSLQLTCASPPMRTTGQQHDDRDPRSLQSIPSLVNTAVMWARLDCRRSRCPSQRCPTHSSTTPQAASLPLIKRPCHSWRHLQHLRWISLQTKASPCQTGECPRRSWSRKTVPASPGPWPRLSRMIRPPLSKVSLCTTIAHSTQPMYKASIWMRTVFSSDACSKLSVTCSAVVKSEFQPHILCQGGAIPHVDQSKCYLQGAHQACSRPALRPARLSRALVAALREQTPAGSEPRGTF